mgnify:FL=1
MEKLTNVVHAKKKTRIPVVFSRQEVSKIIGNLTGTKKTYSKVSLCNRTETKRGFVA